MNGGREGWRGEGGEGGEGGRGGIEYGQGVITRDRSPIFTMLNQPQ